MKKGAAQQGAGSEGHQRKQDALQRTSLGRASG